MQCQKKSFPHKIRILVAKIQILMRFAQAEENKNGVSAVDKTLAVAIANWICNFLFCLLFDALAPIFVLSVHSTNFRRQVLVRSIFVFFALN